MPTYNIERWDAVVPKGNTFPMPMIYIKPDENFIKYGKENNWEVLIQIQDSNSPYDGKSVIGVIDSSGYFPNYRPYFYNKTGYFVITLETEWKGYPSKNGKALLRGFEGQDKLELPKETEYVPPKPLPWNLPFESYTKPEKCNSLSQTQIGYIFILFILVFSVLLYMSYKKDSINK